MCNNVRVRPHTGCQTVRVLPFSRTYNHWAARDLLHFLTCTAFHLLQCLGKLVVLVAMRFFLQFRFMHFQSDLLAAALRRHRRLVARCGGRGADATHLCCRFALRHDRSDLRVFLLRVFECSC